MSAGNTLGRFVATLRNCGLQPGDRVAVALSGGPDSLALASMTVWWQNYVRSQHPPMALVVDHKLRPESTEEAHSVAAQARALGMEAQVLTVDWPPGKLPEGDKMAAAREARYALLLNACAQMGRNQLLVAHHADDQAETFLLRLIHASGVFGLACMPRVAEKHTEHGRVRLVRPLLDLCKSELEAYCRHAGLQYVVDPTNSNLAHHRNRIRHVLQHVPLPPPPPELPAESAGRLAPAGASSNPSSSSSSNGSSSSPGVGVGLSTDSSSSSTSSGNNGSSNTTTSNTSSSTTTSHSHSDLVADILLLQRRCEAATLQQQQLGEQLLRHSVMHTSVDLPTCVPYSLRQQQGQQQQGQRRQSRLAAWMRRAQRQPWFVDWEERLVQMADILEPVPFALLRVSNFRRAPEPVAFGALSRILQAVSGTKYPASLASLARLHQQLESGRLATTYTGGGCLIKRVPRCKGRYALCIAQPDQQRVEEMLRALPPQVTHHHLSRVEQAGQQEGGSPSSSSGKPAAHSARRKQRQPQQQRQTQQQPTQQQRQLLQEASSQRQSGAAGTGTAAAGVRLPSLL